MLNRCAVIVRPKKPFLDWVRAVDYDDSPEVTLDQMDATLYLVPDYEDPTDTEKVLGRACRRILLPGTGGLVHGRRGLAKGPEPKGVQAVV